MCHQTLSTVLKNLMLRKLPLCSCCNAGCQECVCVKSRRQCSNCLPSHKGYCSNTKLPPTLQPPVTAQVLPALSVQGQPSFPTSANLSESSTTVVSEAANPPEVNYSRTDHPQFSPPPFHLSHRYQTHLSGGVSMILSITIIHCLDGSCPLEEDYIPCSIWKRICVGLFRTNAEGPALKSTDLKACTVLPILLLQKS